MAVQFRQEIGEFHLYNDKISYVICILPNGHIANLYYGKRVSEKVSYDYLLERKERPLTAYVYDDETYLSLQHIRQEYACYGTTGFSVPTFEIEQEDGNRLSHFVYQRHRIQTGKPELSGLPHTYVNHAGEATTLEIDLLDSYSETQLTLIYTIFENYAVVTRSACFEQLGEKTVRIDRALSMNLDLPDNNYEWLHLDGAWGRERHVQSSPLHQGIQSVYSLKGASSSEHNPFIALKRSYTDEHMGEVLGFSLIYSGNFLGQVDVTVYGQTRVSMGIHPERFSWQLSKGNTFQTPEVAMVYSDEGLNGMSQTYHALFQHHLIRGYWRDKERPVLLNNWEAMAFDFDEDKILNLAEEASKVGVELFVLDDGWFGTRNSDTSGLGDWTVNLEKLPSGLTGIIHRIHDMGMKFGLWIEPEMVNKDSHLYRQHPDWILHHPQYSESHGRHQYTLDLSREDVYQNIYDQIFQLLSTHAIDYVKWDMNRYMTEVYSVYHASNQQGEVFHRYILNLYRLYDNLTKAFPMILFESCSSGGARFDPGMLYYAPQIWTSDDTDAFERLKIQYGTSLVYPLSSMGCHVSAVPNQQTGRTISLVTRSHVAYFGSFGYELNLALLTEKEKEEIADQIVFYKRYRQIFQYGKFLRLLSPFDQDMSAWQVMSEDESIVIAGYYKGLFKVNGPSCRLRLVGLDPTDSYRLNGEVYSGDQLMYAGLPLQTNCTAGNQSDFMSELFVLTKV